MSAFQEFLAQNPNYAEVYGQLAAGDRKLALSAVTVHALHGGELARVAEPLLAYARQRYGPGMVARFLQRSRRLEDMQKRFDRNPSVEMLGDPQEQVDRNAYHIALLLSIVFANHRFEIVQRLEQFLRGLGSRGRLAGLGTGTGYEVLLAAGILGNWEIESYDIDPTAEVEARRMLHHFGVERDIRFGRELPLEKPDPARYGRYDAIVACEVLEHLADPAQSLRTLRHYLSVTGRMLVTMAVNIAQEDHIFLYPDLASCRRQLRECGWRVVEEWITPHTAWPPPVDREAAFRRGNFVAVVGKD